MKKLTGQIKLQVPAGKANPAPPIGPALGQHGVNIMEFCKQFNALTQAQMKDGLIIPVIISIYQDRSFSLTLKTPPTPILLKKAAGLHTQRTKGRAHSVSRKPSSIKCTRISPLSADSFITRRSGREWGVPGFGTLASRLIAAV